MSESTVIEENRGHVRIIMMNRPERKNAFNNQMYHEMAAAIDRAREDQDVRALVITGKGDAFSAGQDMSEMSIEAGKEMGFVVFLDALIGCDKPVLTAVNGVGLGLGLTMLLHTDINYIADSARLKLPFVTLGVVPEAASSYLLPVVIGHQRAAEILYTARWIGAEETVELGLTFAMLPVDEVLGAAVAKAQEIAENPPSAVRHTKRLMKTWIEQEVTATRNRENKAFETRLGSAENNEAITAFFEKRPPDFSKIPQE